MPRNNLPKIRITLVCLFVLIFAGILLFAHDSVFGDSRGAPRVLPVDKMDAYALEFSTHLPILVMQTDVDLLYDRELPPVAVIWLFDNGELNRLTDMPSEVFDFASARYRGFSSQSIPKKSYKIMLYNAFYNPLEHSFFGLDASSEWVLRTPYFDKSLLRDWFGYEIAATVLDWQPRGKPVQLFLQNADGEIEYHGVYFLCQSIPAAAEKWLNLGKFSLNNSEGIDFDGGGYMIMRDRERSFGYHIITDSGYIYRIMRPNASDISSSQMEMLESEVVFYMDFLNKIGHYENISDEQWVYWDYIDVDSFVHYILTVDLLKVTDGGGFSTFYYRPEGGKLTLGPVWDVDLSMGNTYYVPHEYYGFYSIHYSIVRTLLEDEDFSIRYAQRWRQLRDTIWSDDEILGLFDEMTRYLTEPAAQNAQRWPEMYDGETYIFPNPEPYTMSWDEEIERTREWLAMRLQWLDENIPRLAFESAGEINESWGLPPF